ncbi:hypothetical protein ES708_16624 [subsurface metagenome]
MRTKQKANWDCKWRLEKRHGDINACKSPEERLAFLANTVPYEVIEGEGNCLLNTGINEMWDLITGEVSGAEHIFDETAAKIGVGDSADEEDATETGLQAATNKCHKGMETGYPTSLTQEAVFKASFGSADANYVWNEWVVQHTNESGVALNRKVESLGTKSTGTWTLEVDISLS